MLTHLFRFGAAVSLGTWFCACAVQPGLANAPQLGGSTVVDSRVHDVVADGPDSCGRKLDPGPLRNRIVPCPRLVHASTAKLPAGGTVDPFAVTPWFLSHYVQWSCALSEPSFWPPKDAPPTVLLSEKASVFAVEVVQPFPSCQSVESNP